MLTRSRQLFVHSIVLLVELTQEMREGIGGGRSTVRNSFQVFPMCFPIDILGNRPPLKGARST
jgi:hypothetical protein